MTIKQRATKKLNDTGCVITDDGNTITVDPPSGFILTFTGCHCACIPYRECFKYTKDGRTEWRDATPAERWQEVIDIVSEGIEPCTAHDCDVCESNGCNWSSEEEAWERGVKK